MSRYLFGFHLDGAIAPESHHGLQTAICGPDALLSALETSLGIPPREASGLKRALAYRDVIAASLTGEAFYARSFQCDPLATARLLLSWRDTLCEAGWRPERDHHEAPPRLRALSALDAPFTATGLAQASHAGRISSILAELALGSFAAIDALIVTDALQSLPQCWRTLFSALDATYEAPSPSTAAAGPATTLGSCQADLLGQEPPPARDPHSLRIVTASTPELAADALGSHLAGLDSGSATLIADPSERDSLNPHLRRLDLPLPPSRSESAAALLELPALLLRCRLAPFAPQAWLEFLLHSVSPLPFKLRQRLAKAIDDRPAPGEHWEATLEQCGEGISDDQDLARLRGAYADWITPPLIDPDETSGPALAECIDTLGKWMTKRAGGKASDDNADAAEWLIASREVRQLESILRAEGMLTRTQTERLLAEWHQAASASTRFAGEVGAVNAIASPDQLLAPRDHVIWWRPAPSSAHRPPWTVSEIGWLSAQGVELPDPGKLVLAAEEAAMRAVLMAGKSLTVFHVTQSGGSTTEHAGIVTRLLSLCGSSIVVPARDLITTRPIPRRALPSLRRSWDLAAENLLPARETESFSSISKFIFSPVDWVLDYHARLRPGPTSSLRINDSALRSGSLLHAAAEEVFAAPSPDWRTAGEGELQELMAELFPRLLASQAAHYLTPGNEAARARLLHTAQQSLWHLITILREAEVNEVALEQFVGPVPFRGGQIAGRIDLIARRPDGETAVIDLKLGGKTKRADELVNNRHLQLATYGHLLHHTEGTEPATAFFTLSNGGSLLTRNSVFFANASAISPKRDTPESDWQEGWNEFENVYQWRRQQLDRGLIEVPVPGTEPDDPPPIERWAPPKDGNPYSPYLNLTGWDSHA